MINTRRHPIVHIARLTLEARTALSIGTGSPDGVFDTTLATDANGLPTLPGTSLAGVLRHLYQQVYGNDQENNETTTLFGYQNGADGEPSALCVSWGCIQNSKGAPVEGLLLGEEGKRRLADPLLSHARSLTDAPVFRDRVRIDHRGTAADKGKFDRSVLPAGFRFSVELQLASEQREDERWNRLLGLLAHPAFRLGGNTRAGLGRFEVKSLHTGTFDLRSPDEARAWRALPRQLGDVSGLTQRDVPQEQRFEGVITGTLELRPEDFWRMGGGDRALAKAKKPADLLPKLEARVVWDQNGGRLAAEALLVPASAIKGALSHRVAFHHNLLCGRFADDMADIDHYDKAENEAVQQVFGQVKDKQGGGAAGRLLLDDAYVEVSDNDIQMLMHNAIDRFTGGVRDRMLFSEEAVWKKTITLNIALLTRGLTPEAREALDRAMRDLCEGRLAIGAGGTKGHGYCTGTLRWHNENESLKNLKEAAA